MNIPNDLLTDTTKQNTFASYLKDTEIMSKPLKKNSQLHVEPMGLFDNLHF